MMNEETSSFEALKEEGDADGGVITVHAARMRAAQGAGRLTERINAQISDSLAARGLGHVPFDRKQMPTSQFADVRVYDKTTTLGRVIEAAHTVGNEYDELLRDS